MKIILATNNAHKFSEIRGLFPKQDGIGYLGDFPSFPDVEETGKTFMENAFLKARAVYLKTGIAALADDSGLEVEYLKNGPGVYSKRYAGERATDRDRIRKLLVNLRGIPLPERRARFVCALVFCGPKRVHRVLGFCHGLIGLGPCGRNGFGYDPVFYLPDLDRSMAELSMEEKNRISHRSNALKRMRSLLDDCHDL